jgi:ABC-2 type transport system permease protein
MAAVIYRANFWLMLIQSVINTLLSILCIDFIYNSVESIAGWKKHEMIALICISLIVNNLYRGFIFGNQNRFVNSVNSGKFDRLLLKPVNIIFQINTGQFDLTSIFSMAAPIVVLVIQINFLQLNLTPAQLLLFIVAILNGVIILSSFMLLLYSLVFLYIKVDGLDNIYYLMMNIADKPKEMFERKIVYGFIFIIPVVPIANAPASILLMKSSFRQVAAYLFVGVLFSCLALLAVKAGLKRYASASS